MVVFKEENPVEEITTTTVSVANTLQFKDEKAKENFDKMLVSARRTAFVSRFIVLRESKKTKAHRVIEKMTWSDDTTAEELAMMFWQAFINNGDNIEPVDRDIRRALGHSKRSLNYFVVEYAKRSTLNFIDALWDYEKSNTLLFGEDENPRTGGWRLPSEIKK